jgi:hypothetical protein
MATVGYGERVTRTISVTPGTQYTVTIGAGGKGGEGITAHNSNYIYGTAGEASSALGVTARGGVYNGSSNTNYSNGGSPAGKSSGSQGSTRGNGVDGFCILSYKVDKDKYSQKMSSIPKTVFEMQKKDGSKYLLYKDVVTLKRVRLIYKTVGTYSLRIPAGITKIYVTGCGGGAGGITVGAYNSCPTLDMQAGNGGDTKVGSYVIPGGQGATATLRSGNVMTVNQPAASKNGVRGQYVTARNRDFSVHGYGFLLNKNGVATLADVMGKVGYYYANVLGTKDSVTYASTGTFESFNIYGAGGGSYHFFDSDGTSNQIGVAGNSGAYVADAEVEVIPNSTIQIVVGAGGKNTFYSNDGDRAGRFRVSDGTQGFLIIEYGGTTPYMPTVNKEAELTCRCYLDDSVIMGSTVTVNGETHHTNQLGVFSLLNKTWGRKEKLTFEYIDSSGVLHTAAYNVQYGAIEVLEVKFISVITGEKHFSSSETTASFTVPIGITKIKVDADCLIADAPFEEDVSYAISVINNSTKKVWGSGYSYSNLEDEGNTDHQDMHSIVAVTAGKTYTLTLNISDSVDGVTFSWGTDINELTATVSDL